MQEPSKSKQLLDKLSKRKKAYYIKNIGLFCLSLKEATLDKAGWDYKTGAFDKCVTISTVDENYVTIPNALKMLFLTKKEAKLGFLKALKRNRKYLVSHINKLKEELNKIDEQLKDF